MQRIQSAEVQLKCFSLTYFLRHVASLRDKEAMERDRDLKPGDDDDDASCCTENSLRSTCTLNTIGTAASGANYKNDRHSKRGVEKKSIEDIQPRTTTRFLPLIVDEEHAERALPLLQEELLRLDR